jgi:hypothetical protein
MEIKKSVITIGAERSNSFRLPLLPAKTFLTNIENNERLQSTKKNALTYALNFVYYWRVISEYRRKHAEKLIAEQTEVFELH